MSRVLLIPSLLLLMLGTVCYLISAHPGTVVVDSRHKPIVFCNGDEISTLDVGKMSWSSDIRAAMGLWEGLVAYEPKDLTPVPGVAERWDISPDGRTYTFHLRRDARWSNGQSVTADDFIFAWKRVLTPSTGSDYISLFHQHVAGAEEYTRAILAHTDALKEGRTPPPLPTAIAGVDSPDSRTLIVRLKNPCTYFLDLCGFPTFYPLYEPAMRPFLDPSDPLKGYSGPWTHPPHIVSNGPFQLTDWAFKKHLLYTPNPHYWDRANVKCEALYIKAIPNDDRAALLALQTGTIDVLSFIPQSFGEDLLNEQRAGRRRDVHFRPVFGSYYYIFNCTRPPLDDKRVRKALSLVVDRQQIVTQITRMGQRPIGVFVPPDSIAGPPPYLSPPGLEQDIDLARQLLAQAGYPQGRGLRTLEILYNSDASGHAKIAQAIGQMWERHLGVKVTYRALERGGFGAARKERVGGKPTFDVARAGWFGDYMDPTTWLDILRARDNNNDGAFDCAPYEELLDRAAAEPDPGRRFELLRQAESMVVQEELPVLPLYQYSDGYMFDDRQILGLDMNVRLLTQFKWIHRAEDR